MITLFIEVFRNLTILGAAGLLVIGLESAANIISDAINKR
jgi:hypothetical protein